MRWPDWGSDGLRGVRSLPPYRPASRQARPRPYCLAGLRIPRSGSKLDRPLEPRDRLRVLPLSGETHAQNGLLMCRAGARLRRLSRCRAASRSYGGAWLPERPRRRIASRRRRTVDFEATSGLQSREPIGDPPRLGGHAGQRLRPVTGCVPRYPAPWRGIGCAPRRAVTTWDRRFTRGRPAGRRSRG